MSAKPRYTAEFVERGYNNRAAVPEHPRFLAEYAERSQAAVAALAPKLDLRYGPNTRETLDLFLPAGTPRGTFAFIHGGYWRALDKADFAFVAAPFVAQGYAAAVINYDLCPSVTIATIVDECRRALLWLAREAPRHGAPAAPPFVAGVTLSGVHDLGPLVLSTMNADLRLDEAEARRMSPVHYRSQTRAPLHVAVGAGETAEFLRQSQLIFDAWPDNRPAGMEQPRFIPDRNHFTVVLDYADPASELTRATLAGFAAPRA